jgi:hypothetical protein
MRQACCHPEKKHPRTPEIGCLFNWSQNIKNTIGPNKIYLAKGSLDSWPNKRSKDHKAPARGTKVCRVVEKALGRHEKGRRVVGRGKERR